MDKKIKISFDFDLTLRDSKEVQEYCKELLKDSNVEVFITTRRYESEKFANPEDPWWRNIGSKNWEDVFKLADEFGIKRENIKFCNMQDKSDYLKTTDFLWHLDDDVVEIKQINKETKIRGILCQPYNSWKWQCNNLIQEKLQKV